jgi:hypothetical protein
MILLKNTVSYAIAMGIFRRIINTAAKYYFQASLSLVGFTVAANPRLLNDTTFLWPNQYWLGSLTFVLIIAAYFRKRTWVAEMIGLYLRAIVWILGIFTVLAFGTIVLALPFATNPEVIGGIVLLFSAAAGIFFSTDLLTSGLTGIASTIRGPKLGEKTIIAAEFL